MAVRKSLRQPAGARELQQALATADGDRDGLIDSREFMEWWRSD